MNIQKIIKENHISEEYGFEINGYNIYVIRDEKYKPWFKCKDICKLLKYKNNTKAIIDHVTKNNAKLFGELKKNLKKSPKNSQPHTVFINKKGLIQLLMASRLSGMDKLCKMLGIKTIYRYKAKEIEILDELSIFFSELDIKYISQKITGKYKIDIYVPKYKLAIEIDEYDHKDRDIKYEGLREKYIKKTLDCKFIRCNPDEPNFNIIQLTAKITKHMINHLNS